MNLLELKVRAKNTVNKEEGKLNFIYLLLFLNYYKKGYSKFLLYSSMLFILSLSSGPKERAYFK